VWGYATKDLLGPLGIGLVGLMGASMMAALMSTADTLMLTVSGLVLHNIYRPLVKEKSETHYVWAGRVFGGLFLIGTALIATQFDDIFEILKFVWEFYVIFAAAFWLGLKWRRANRQGAWSSILITLCVFYLLPVIVPTVFTSLQTNESLLLQTETSPVIRNYTARELEVEERNKEIEEWNQKNELGLVNTEKPQELKVGEKYTKTFYLPSKSIFWSKQAGINEDGILEARGYMYPELILLQSIGFDLSKLPYSLVETIRMMIRLITPFIILIFVSLITRPNNDLSTTHFFLKMRTRVRGFGPEQDMADVKNAIDNPEKTKEVLLFPNSQLEVYKWNKQDTYGFFISVGIVLLVIGTLYGVIKIF
jgi:SSS family solute:Na+ symporter